MTDTTMELVTEIVTAFVSNNQIEKSEISALIRSTYMTVAKIGGSTPDGSEEVLRATRARIKQSIRPDGLVSFIDGKTYKTLSRHLSRHGLTAADYKAQFGLPLDYPMISSEYSAVRAKLAREAGLGRKTGDEAPSKVAAHARRVSG